ncbi:RNA polymerase sigma factor [Actinophytocola gossypii]|uniref:RNA polymerase sigma factor n=1 Tax=Actinophytocola gossypii TaxID=2812003 RepID=A0ABT2J1F2_9PSEU|nr:RNA polymerase sigma factor [Actinophytocola gossypii]MCT2581687.1 RNA polymerase sigma factor [Actinophytocola gossypii]
MARARAGDRDAYARLVARHGALAHRTAYLLGAGDDAEDVVQEAFVKAYRALGSFRDGAPFRPWLLRIVANETSNLHRSARRRRTLELRLAERDVDPVEPEHEAVAADARAALVAAVNAMPYRDRQVLACRYFLDLSEAETAQVLAWPRGSVKSRLSRALDRLRRALPTGLAREVTRD